MFSYLFPPFTHSVLYIMVRELVDKVICIMFAVSGKHDSTLCGEYVALCVLIWSQYQQ